MLAPGGTARARLEIDGQRVSPRVVARRSRADGILFELQTRTIAREGATITASALDGQGQPTSSVSVSDVHLLGEGAFGTAARLRPDATGSSRAAAIVSSTSSPVGISVACYGSGKLAEAGQDTTTRAGSTLKAAIVLAALARRNGDPSLSSSFATYTSAIVASDNNAANQVISQVGEGDMAAGTAAVNDLMRAVGMRDTVLDGPYVQTAGRSRKVTTAADLRILAGALLETARDGSGALADLGVSQQEARVLIGLMSSADYPGLVREHVPEPVAHKAGWLDDQQNDLALIFGGPDGTCAVGMITEGLSFSAADALGARMADEVLPVLAAPVSADGPDTTQTPRATTRARTTTAPAEPAPGTTTSSTAPSDGATVSPAPVASDDDGGPPGPGWVWLAGIGVPLVLIGLAIARRIQVVRRRQRRRLTRRIDR